MATVQQQQGDIENSGGEKPAAAEAVDVVQRSDRGWVSWLVPLIVVINIAVFVVEMYVNDCPKQIRNRVNAGSGQDRCVARFLGRFSFQPFSENPLIGPSSSTLEKLGGLSWSRVVQEHQGWRLISCIWLHAGLIHLVVNMISLILIGVRLEQHFGFDFSFLSLPVRICIIYLVSGFGGSVLSSLFIRNAISVGASGALFGLLGAMLSELITNWSIYTNKVTALLSLLFIVLINLAVGILPHVDNFAHIGGFLTGILLGFVLLPRPQFGWLARANLPPGVGVQSKYKPYQYILWVISLGLLIAGFAIALVMLFRGVNGYHRCHWCRYLNCVPTASWTCNER